MQQSHDKYVVIAVPSAPHGHGGIARQMAYLQQVWPQRSDWKLRWLTTWQPSGCKVCRYMLALLQLVWLRKRGRLDVLHINLASQGSFYRKYLLAKLARLMRIPLVLHLHGGGFEPFYDSAPDAVQKRIAWLFYQAHHCVVLGAHAKRFLELRFRMLPEKITILPNAVPDASFILDTKAANEVPQLLTVGQVSARKGMDDLLEALAGITATAWQLTVVGQGDIAYYRNKAAELGLGARVSF
jgi:glycosyltransferase involved in cell wall biosynthesis